jgi:protoporphyrinogen/coproporphyrinogen III oxidase
MSDRANNGARRGLRFAVVGGGIAGIAAAEELHMEGHAVELFDAQQVLGGRIASQLLGEHEICMGGKNIGERYLRLRELLSRRGHDAYEHFGPDTATLIRGRIQTLSFRSPSMRARLGARVLLHGEARGGLRFLRLAEHVRREQESRFLGERFFADLAARDGDPTLADYLGRALCRDVVRHITVRMNAAEPDECHTGNLGSNLALVVDRFDQLAGAGFGPWLAELTRSHSTHLATPIARLLAENGRVHGVLAADGEEHTGFDGVVLAVPAHEAARILCDLDPALASLLGTIRYFPVAVVVAMYDRPVFPDRFAALSAPAGMALSNAGSYGLGERNIVRYTFSGAPARGRIEPDSFDPQARLEEAERFLAPHTPIAGARRLRFAARAFQPGLCAYRRDHAAFLRDAGARLRSLPGLVLAGDYMRGASLEACVRGGQEAAAQVASGSTLVLQSDCSANVGTLGG